MKSRMERYYVDDTSSLERTKKNANLYKEVYGHYSNLDNLPIEDNSNEIDLTNLKSIVTSREDYKKIREYREVIKEEKVNDIPKKEIEVKRRVYDINELLATAKRDNVHIDKEVIAKMESNFLSNMSDENINNELEVKTLEQLEKMQNNEIINEIKSPSNKKTSDNVSEDSFPLDLLTDLKSKDDTIVSAPIVEKEEENLEKTFYSGSYTFTKKDFSDDEDFLIEKNKHRGIKILFVIIIIAIVFVMLYYLFRFLGIINF